VTCLDVLEHLNHPTLALSEVFRVLRRRGFLVITSPNVTLLFQLIWWAWTRFGMGKHWESNSPHILTYNLWNQTKFGMSLIERLRDIGFKPERTAMTNWKMMAGVRAVKI
jgi:ubiquinone/menaquinone biosynthesis C-methylase UbiE